MMTYQDSEAQTDCVVIVANKKSAPSGQPSLADDLGVSLSSPSRQHAATQTESVTVRASRGRGSGLSGKRRKGGRTTPRLSKRIKSAGEETAPSAEESAQSDPIPKLTPQALQQLSDEDQARYVECARELHLHADKIVLEIRAQMIPRYVEEATFYIRCLRVGQDMPDLELRNPIGTSGDTCSALSNLSNLQGRRKVAPWLQGFCLAMMRGLNFLGNSVDGEESASTFGFVDFILEQLDFPRAGAAQLPLPGGRELVFLVHYRFASRLRTLGRALESKNLVRRAASGQLIWDAACDHFSDTAWTWQGQWPKPGDASKFPSAPEPGYLLPAMEAAGAGGSDQSMGKDMDVESVTENEGTQAVGQDFEEDAEGL